MLAGIRFYRLDVTNPFVEVIAHDFDDWQSLKTCVVEEWKAFRPRNMRVLMNADARTVPDAVTDVSIFVSRYGDMAPVDGRISLQSFASPEQAVEIVKARYSQLDDDYPELARRLDRPAPEELTEWHRLDLVKAIHADVAGRDEVVGLLAIEPGSIEWIEGDVVSTEVVLDRFSGHGFAASAQRAWAAEPDIAPDRLLIGTIDLLNAASRRTATRAGRAPIMDYVFLPLTIQR